MDSNQTKIAIVDPRDILSQFGTNNPHCQIVYDEVEKILIIEHLWGTDGIKISLDEGDEDIKDLNNVVINPLFDAIIHLDSNQVEFVYGFIDSEDKEKLQEMDRAFEIFLDGEKFSCSFREPTGRLFLFARCFRRQPTSKVENIVPQITPFKDYQYLETLPDYIKRYFAHRIPRSFYVKPEKPIGEVDLIRVARNINFIMKYYDRKSPIIVIRDRDDNHDKGLHVQRRMIKDRFPNSVAIREIDEYLLRLLEVASETTPRFAFVYYYQVIEYAAFYYLDGKVKKELRQFLRNPTIIECDDSELSQLFTFMCEKMENDDVRMQRVIEEYCDPAIIWREIENDKDFFSKSIEFDGEVTVSPLIACDTSEETWKAMWTPKLYQYFTKIRNAIAHAREKRQNNVIAPTENNSLLILRVLPLIQRTAEMIAFMKE